MKKTSLRIWIWIFFIIGFINIPKANAVPPPDFIIQIASQLWNFFVIWLAILSWLYATSFQFIKGYFMNHRKKFIFLSVIWILIISFTWAYYYDKYYQKIQLEKMNKEWLNQVKINDLKYKNIENFKSSDVSVNDKESLVEIKKENEDIGITFIKQYYSYIDKKEYNKAYNLSKKNVNYKIFENRYKDTTKITVYNILKIDKDKYSLNLELEEKNKSTNYNVLMTLIFVDNKPVKIEKSIVTSFDKNWDKDNTLSEDFSNKSSWPQENDAYNFYENNNDIPIVISNNDLKDKINNNKDNYIILDARENLEYEIWNIPWSIHIRYADLQAGRWMELPKDKYIYVLCWSWMRGKEVAEYLKSKQLIVQYLEKWADSWVSSWWKWDWEIKFSKIYWKENQKLVFSTSQVKEKLKDGIILIDSREPVKYNLKHIKDALNIPIMYTPSNDIENIFSQVAKGGSVIIICDDYINCFDAKITWIELEKRWIIFLGRYNKPWEF